MKPSIAQKAFSSGFMQGILLALLWLMLWAVGILAEYTYHASLWFPPAGLTFAALLIVGLRAIPSIFIAAIVSTFWTVQIYELDLSGTNTLIAGIQFGVAHILAYAAGAKLLKYVGDHEDHRLPVIIISFLIIAAVVSLLATVLVLTALVTSGLMSAEQIGESWLPFWVGDMVALIVLAPLFASLFLGFYTRPVFEISPLYLPKTKQPVSGFLIKLSICVLFVVAVMQTTLWVGTLESAFLIFFLIIPQMWLTFSENTFRTVCSLAILSFVIVLLVYLLGLEQFAFVYKFAIAIIATTAYFGVAIPLLVSDNDSLRQRVMFDSLTQAASRDYLVQQVEFEIERCLRSKRSMCLLVIDIDHFKRINDTFGHAVGDQALMQLSQAITEILRGTDVLARFGGDEFVALLPDTDLSRAQHIADRIQARVKDIRVRNDYSITTSIGIAEFEVADCFNSLFRKADHALYEAKHSGRDQIRVCV